METKSYILVMDVGSGSGRALVFDAEGREVSVAQKEWQPKAIAQYPGSQVFETKEAWKIISLCARQAVQKSGIDPSRIIGVSASSMREGIVLYDSDHQEIWACPNVDARAREEVV